MERIIKKMSEDIFKEKMSEGYVKKETTESSNNHYFKKIVEEELKVKIGY